MERPRYVGYRKKVRLDKLIEAAADGKVISICQGPSAAVALARVGRWISAVPGGKLPGS